MGKKIERKYREFIHYSWLFLCGGIVLFGIGLYSFFFLEPDIGVYLKSQQPFIANGTIALVLGIGFFSGGLYRILNRKKSFKNEIDFEFEIKEKENQERRKKFGFK
jgi:tellurite resistance protein TehA-like permease